LLTVDRAIFGGKRGEPHELSASALKVSGALVWREVKMPNGAQLYSAETRGSLVIYYLLDADNRGWILSAIFVAV
jgi:hypothetical protein